MESSSWEDRLKKGFLKLTTGRRRGQTPMASFTVQIPWVDPLAVFDRAQAERAFLERPLEGLSMVGVGSLWGFSAFGKDRFERASWAWKELLSRMVVSEEDHPPLRAPVGFAGFAFDPMVPPSAGWLPFTQGRIVLPKLLVVSKGGLSWLTLNVMPAEEEGSIQSRIVEARRLLDRAHRGIEGFLGLYPGNFTKAFKESLNDEAWKEAVIKALQKVRKGEVQKVVLARRVSVQQECGFKPAIVLKKMRHDFSECTLFAFFKDGSCFLGATPERLVSLEDGNRIRVSCLAGSSRRGMGSKEDLKLEEGLFLDSKNRREHAFVVDAVRRALEPVCRELEIPSTPTLIRMKNIRHLHTPVLGLLKKRPGSVIDLVGLLHPTPAVGGVPKEKALSLIRELEVFDRGWYAGPVGWVDGSGGGAMFVAIRSALVSGSEAHLYAGCGIVADSDPEEELEESRLKLEAMRWMLNGKG